MFSDVIGFRQSTNNVNSPTLHCTVDFYHNKLNQSNFVWMIEFLALMEVCTLWMLSSISYFIIFIFVVISLVLFQYFRYL